MLSKEFLQRIQKLGVFKIASYYTELTKESNGIWKGRCPNPNHQDNTPSFMVQIEPDDNQHWCCFGCHVGAKGGNNFGTDNIAFVQWLYFNKYKKFLTLYQAVQILCKFYHVDIEEDKYDYIYRQNENSCKHFEKNITDEVRYYLNWRGLDDVDIKKWRLGFNGERITFPIMNSSNRIIGFSNRRYIKKSKPESKYINSKTSPIFNKKKVLYGIQFVNKAQKELFLVEGQLDAILAQKYGLENVVATMTCHLSEDHIRIIKNGGFAPVFCYDGDEAGRRGVQKALEILYKAGVTNAKVLIMPTGKDMADLATNKKHSLKDYVYAHTMPYSQYILGNLANEIDSKINSQIQLMIPKIQEILSTIIDPAERLMAQNYINKRIFMWQAA